jgi:hypothetical protein
MILDLELTCEEMERLQQIRSGWSDDEMARRAEGYRVSEMVQMFAGHQRQLELKRQRDLRRVRRLRGMD